LIRILVIGGAVIAAPALAQIETCAACHGPQAVSTMALTPSLAGQPAFYTTAQLVLFRNGQRKSDVMAPLAKNLSDDDVRALGERFEKMPPPRATAKPDPARAKRARALIAREHCDSCHLPDFSGEQNAPRLASQREDYLRKALRDYKKGARVGWGNAVMPELVSGLTDAELNDLAHYLARLR
jgi:cytochrome c553